MLSKTSYFAGSDTYSAWLRFTEKGEIDPTRVRPIIAESWKRSKAFGIDPYDKSSLSYRLDEEALASRRKANKELLKVAIPFMRILYGVVKGSGFRVDLTDREGYLLYTLGMEEVAGEAFTVPFLVGANRLESFAGTTGIGLALATGQPIQVVGSEHYNFHLHRWTCSSAPVRNPHGEVIGVLNMGGHHNLVHKHTLGVVLGTAQSIEKQLALRKSTQELALTNEFLTTVLSNINDGLVAVNKHGFITHFNGMAAKILQCTPEDMLGLPIEKAFSTYPELRRALNGSDGREILDAETVIRGKNGSTRCFLSTKPIRRNNETIGIVVIMGKVDRVRKLVHRMVGAQARFTFDDIIGEDKRLKDAVELAKVAAKSSAKVLLQGESGTGKELFAQGIHNASPRSDGPFVAVNCAAVPRDLIESELFGYEDGAFTGAKKGGKPGKFELAEGGTLFLDEIESMPIEMQAKLLRVLEDGQVIRVGGSEVIPVNVRVVAATNRDLRAEVMNGSFREDLLYRLNVITINIPALRERRSDIPILIEHFLKRRAAATGDAKVLAPRALEILCRYSYPGNVRELQNIIERACLVSRSGVITPEDLPLTVRNHVAERGMQRVLKNNEWDLINDRTYVGDSLNDAQDGSPIMTLAEAERRTILNALRVASGNISFAAQVLGVSRSTLHRRLKEYRLGIHLQESKSTQHYPGSH